MLQQSDNAIGIAIARNLNHLFNTYGPGLGIELTTGGIIRHYRKKRVELAPATIRTFLSGKAKHARETTLDELVHVFQEEFKDIKGSWLTARDESTFLGLLGKRDVIEFKISGYKENVASLAQWIKGTYVAYRYSFEGRSAKEVTREVLHIWLDDKLVLRFRMSFWSRGAEPGQEALEFVGHVLPVGTSILFVALSEGQAKRDRGRTFFLHDDRSHPRLRNCALGILSSTRLHGDWAPCVACTILVRVDRELSGDELAQFIQDATLIDETGSLVREDFGSTYGTWIEAFIDNRPGGARKETRIAKLDRKANRREAVLRLDRQRFIETMPDILEDVMGDSKIQAPYKANWRAPPKPKNVAEQAVGNGRTPPKKGIRKKKRG